MSDHDNAVRRRWPTSTTTDAPLGLRHRLHRPARRASTPPCPTGSTPPRWRAYCLMLGDDALIYSTACSSGDPRCRSSRRRPRSPTSRSTCSARPGCCSPAPARIRRPRPRTSSPSSATRTSSATCGSSSAPTPTSPSSSAGCWSSPPGGSRCSSGCADSPDPVLAAIAAKGVKELTYHRDYAAQWVVRLGDGTDAVAASACRPRSTRVWPLVDELFDPAPTATRARRPRPSSTSCSTPCSPRPGCERPAVAPLAAVGGRAGRDGVHTEAMGYVLAELQSVARAHPDATW